MSLIIEHDHGIDSMSIDTTLYSTTVVTDVHVPLQSTIPSAVYSPQSTSVPFWIHLYFHVGAKSSTTSKCFFIGLCSAPYILPSYPYKISSQQPSSAMPCIDLMLDVLCRTINPSQNITWGAANPSVNMHIKCTQRNIVPGREKKTAVASLAKTLTWRTYLWLRYRVRFRAC